MPIKKVKFLNYNTSYSYAPTQEDAIINTDHITSAVPCEARGSGPFLKVTFIDGKSLVIVGTADDLLKQT